MHKEKLTCIGFRVDNSKTVSIIQKAKIEVEKLILVGVVLKPKGINGEVVIKSLTELPENIFNLNLIMKQDGGIEKCKLKLVRKSSSGELICKIHGVNNRTAVEFLRGRKIFCTRDDLPQIKDENEFYAEDLKNLVVVSESLESIGTVVNVYNFGAGDMLELQFADSQKTELIPFTQDYFPKITKDYVVLKLTDRL